MNIICGSAGFTRRDYDGRTVAIPDGSPHYRLIGPGSRAERIGWKVVVTDTLDVKASGELVGVDLPTGDRVTGPIVIFQRWMMRGGAEIVRRARATGQVILQDIDDDFERLRPSNRAYHSHKPENNPKHFAKIIAASDGVICSTPALAKRMRKHNPNVAVWRNAVNPEVFGPAPVSTVPGWAGHLGYRSGDLEHVRPGIEALYRERGALSFVHAGVAPDDTDTAADRLGIDPARQVSIPGTDIARYPGILANIGIGIVPLAPVAFNKAKSWLKGLEYAAAGIPFVASALPEYLALEAEGAGVCARTPLEWTRELARLIDDDGHREALRASGLVTAERLGIENTWQNWTEAIAALSPVPISGARISETSPQTLASSSAR